ncbi:hypothetical protein [Pajaroellobacter abortibovis]|uniref:Uncharacterized protein n=1 Tax=Pajaroellobacter abortibovis TaxID=1882918 RepID=A0A1L6MXB2_9BACT|nr:hypothetical protein [Pajaroellobacter abortibovis]APS00213.1 hypothetical protein BCY86_05600 [Pajaroellobacter abortibovis]
MFLFTIPVLLFGIYRIQSHEKIKQIVKDISLSCLLGIGAVLLLDGAFFNPSGFLKRIHFLLGQASRDYYYYPRGIVGAGRTIRGSILHFSLYYPPVVGVLVILRIGIAIDISGMDGLA